jgi:hypothetical protein
MPPPRGLTDAINDPLDDNPIREKAFLASLFDHYIPGRLDASCLHDTMSFRFQRTDFKVGENLVSEFLIFSGPEFFLNIRRKLGALIIQSESVDRRAAENAENSVRAYLS